MGDSKTFLITFKKKIEPFLAIGIFIMLLLLVVGLYNESKTTKEIKENCGWGEDDFFCFCKKGEAMRMKNEAEFGGSLGMGLALPNLTFKNVSVDR